MSRIPSFVLALLIVTVAVVRATPVAANSDAGVTPPPMDMGFCAGADPTFEPAAAVVGASYTGGVIVERDSGAPGIAEITAQQTDASGVTTPLAFTLEPIDATHVRVRLSAPLVAGTDVRISAEHCADRPDPTGWPSVDLMVVSESGQPTTLGTITGPSHADRHEDGSDWYGISWYDPSDEARAWQYSYRAALEIDGVVQPTQVWLSALIDGGTPSPNIEVVSISCPGGPTGTLSPGPHVFRLAGGLYGEPAHAFTDPLSVTLDCPPIPAPMMPGDCVDLGTFHDGGAAGGFCPMDAGSLPLPMCTSDPVDGGAPCIPRTGGCSVTHAAPSGGACVLFGAVIALVRTRKRR